MSTASSLEITLKFKIIYRLLFMSATPASVPDDTEVVPPKSQMRIHRPSIPFPLIDDEPFFWSSVNRFPEQEGGRPAHGIDSPHNEGESRSLLLTAGVPVARPSVTTLNHSPHLDDENSCAL